MLTVLIQTKMKRINGKIGNEEKGGGVGGGWLDYRQNQANIFLLIAKAAFSMVIFLVNVERSQIIHSVAWFDANLCICGYILLAKQFLNYHFYWASDYGYQLLQQISCIPLQLLEKSTQLTQLKGTQITFHASLVCGHSFVHYRLKSVD